MPLKRRVLLCLSLIVAITVVPVSAGNAAVAAGGARGPHTPATAFSLAADPADDAIGLVDTIYGPDEEAAEHAAIELLRRAGVPVVSIDGPVVGLPDERVLEDAAVYAEFMRVLTRAARQGTGYTATELTQLLVALEAVDPELPANVLVAGLGRWGKDPEAPVESQVAGAAVRAFSARRGQVLYGGADPDAVVLNPLQTILILAHFTSREYLRAVPTASRGPGVASISPFDGTPAASIAPVQAQKGPCDDLADALDKSQVGEIIFDKIKSPVVDSWKDLLPDDVKSGWERRKDVYEKGAAVLNLLLLYWGAQLELSADQTSTHFKHSEGEVDTHIVLTAVARFDSTIANKHVKCYKLAGIDVPPSGPLKGFKVRWSLSQPTGTVGGTGYAGKYLTVHPDDSTKAGGCGTCGDTTGSDGRSTLELYPPVETKPGSGKILKGYVGVKASLDKADFPFKLKDLLTLHKPGEFALSKIWDLAVSAISRAELPSAWTGLEVKYHGKDIYVVKGSSDAWLFYILLPVRLDVYTCEGLEGQWQGRGGWAPWSKTFFGDALEQVAGAVGYNGPPIPENYEVMNENLRFQVNTEHGAGMFDINGYMKGLMTIDRVPEGNDHVNGVVGEVELFMGEDASLHAPGVMLGLWSAKYPVVGVESDPRCEGQGEDDYQIERYPGKKSR